jgi:putative ABC transport system permease protein
MGKGLFGRRKRDEELDEEVQSHLRMAAEDRVAQGETAEDARAAARREFGNVALVKEDTRQMWGWTWLEQLAADVRYGLRQLRRNPGFTAVAILTLALGIGANTAIFSAVDAVLLRPLPFVDPGQLVTVFQARPQDGIPADGFSYPNFTECREHNNVFTEMAATQAHDLTLTGAGQPTLVHAVVVTPEIFTLLGAEPIAGRTLLPQDGLRGAAPVVVVSENLWRSLFGADPNLLGRTMDLDKRSYSVVGIMPADFRYPIRSESEDVWIPLAQDPLFSGMMPRPGGHWLTVVARLRRGVSLAQARSAMEAMSGRLARLYPQENSGWKIRVEPLKQEIAGASRPALLILFGAVGLVLLIACVNIANLLLARASARAREMAVRLALGAGRARVVRQLLTESAMLGLLGGAAGILLAFWGVHTFKSLLPPGLPRAQTIRVDGGVLLFALAISAASSFIFGLAPALKAARHSFRASLAEGAARSGESGGRLRLLGWLVAAEMALSVVLLAGAGLLIRSFAALTDVNPGFNARHVIAAEISLPQFQYSTPRQWTRFSNQALERIQAQPGLHDAAFAVPVPIKDGFVNLGFGIVGRPPLSPGASRSADYAAVSPGYFHVMEVPLLRGRLFSAQDQPAAPPVILISQAFARRYFPHQDPLGQHLQFKFLANPDVPREIVGVVGDVRDVALSQDPGPMMYVPFAQAPFWGGTVVVRSSLSTAEVAESIRRVVRGIDKDLPVTDIARLPQAMDSQPSVALPRFRTLLLGLFAGMALLLAAVGIFGLVSYSVTCRTREIGIRIALGARAREILGLMVGQGLRLALAGLALGVIAALAVTRLLSGLLFGVAPRDPVTFAAAAVILAAVALLASYIPARRATRVDPMAALRHE